MNQSNEPIDVQELLAPLRAKENECEGALHEANLRWREARGIRVLAEIGYRLGDIVEVKTDKTTQRLVIIGAGYFPRGRILKQDGTLGKEHNIWRDSKVVGHQQFDAAPQWRE